VERTYVYASLRHLIGLTDGICWCWNILKWTPMDRNLIAKLHVGQRAVIRIDRELSGCCIIRQGVRQGCPLIFISITAVAAPEFFFWGGARSLSPPFPYLLPFPFPSSFPPSLSSSPSLPFPPLKTKRQTGRAPLPFPSSALLSPPFPSP